MSTKSIKRIEIKNLSKKFNADHVKHVGALSFFINTLMRKKEKKDIIVTDDISFNVYSGEILGIVGKNGAGKSSLLRMIAGVYKSDSGRIRTHGKVVYLSGLGHGLIYKLTMRENIILMGSILGLSQKDIKNKFDEIVEFADLKDHVNMKIQQFSTGMISRLVFSVMIHSVHHQNPDILLVDEVLSAGGDADFQNKATTKIEKLIKGGAAVIMVSHDMEILKKYCDEVMWIDGGNIKMKGDSERVIREYLEGFK